MVSITTDEYRILSSRWKIPEKKFADIILDFFTREDELLVLIAKILIDIDGKIDRLSSRTASGTINIDLSPLNSSIAALSSSINSLISELRSRQITTIDVRNRPIVYVGGDRSEIDKDDTYIYDINDGDIVMIHNIGDYMIHYMFGSTPTESSPAIDSGGAIAINIPNNIYKNLFIKSPYGKSEVIIS